MVGVPAFKNVICKASSYFYITFLNLYKGKDTKTPSDTGKTSLHAYHHVGITYSHNRNSDAFI